MELSQGTSLHLEDDVMGGGGLQRDLVKRRQTARVYLQLPYDFALNLIQMDLIPQSQTHKKGTSTSMQGRTKRFARAG